MDTPYIIRFRLNHIPNQLLFFLYPLLSQDASTRSNIVEDFPDSCSHVSVREDDVVDLAYLFRVVIGIFVLEAIGSFAEATELDGLRGCFRRVFLTKLCTDMAVSEDQGGLYTE